MSSWMLVSSRMAITLASATMIDGGDRLADTVRSNCVQRQTIHRDARNQVEVLCCFCDPESTLVCFHALTSSGLTLVPDVTQLPLEYCASTLIISFILVSM